MYQKTLASSITGVLVILVASSAFSLAEGTHTKRSSTPREPFQEFYNYDNPGQYQYQYPGMEHSTPSRRILHKPKEDFDFSQFLYNPMSLDMFDTTLPKPILSNDLSQSPQFPYSFPPFYYPDLSIYPQLSQSSGDQSTSLGFPLMFDPLSHSGNDLEDEVDTSEHDFGWSNETTTTESPVNVTSTTELTTTTTEVPTTTEEEITTTLAPFTLADVKVPIPFLRIEYMISFTFFGLMYGLGFLVLFQSLCVPAAKLAVTIVYLVLVKLNSIDPVTLEQALAQLPPI